MKNPCWKRYKAVGFKKKDGKRVPNCVPVKEELGSVEIETSQYHEELNPIAWEGTTLKNDVKSALLRVAHTFINSWDLSVPVRDIILTGSNANYNWTKFSDFDLHIIVDMGSVIGADRTIVQALLKAKKNLFNKNHNIRVKGYPVELYAQDNNEVLVATGVYSLTQDRWLTLPMKVPPKFDHPSISAKAEEFVNEVALAIASKNEEKIKEVQQKISQLRKAGLQSGGEFSTENLVFKVLRNSGAIEKLHQTLLMLSDTELSLEHHMISFKEFLSEAKTGTLHSFDVDETLFKTNARVHVMHGKKKVKSLSNAKFNTHKLKPGHHYDFSEFRSAKKFHDQSKPIHRMLRKVKAIHKNIQGKANHKIIINTARSDMDNKHVYLHKFKKHGVPIHDIHVHRAGNDKSKASVAAKKAMVISHQIKKHGYKKVHVYDDSKTNLKHALNLMKKHKGVQVHAWHVQHNGTVKKYIGEQILAEKMLSAQARYAKKRTMQRYKWKLTRRHKIALGIPASNKRLNRRTELAAKRMLYKGLLHGMKKSKLTATQRASYERYIKQRAKYYEPGIGHNLKPKLRRKDTLRVAKKYH